MRRSALHGKGLRADGIRRLAAAPLAQSVENLGSARVVEHRVVHAVHDEQACFPLLDHLPHGPARPTSWLQPRYSVTEDDSPATIRAAVEQRTGTAEAAVSFGKRVVKRWR